MNQKYYVTLTGQERRMVIESLNRLRNKLISAGRYTDAVDEPEEQQPIGVWGQRHLRYLKKYHRVFYANLLTSGKLNSYLTDIDRQAQDIFERPVKQMAEREGVTEQLKAADQMEWVHRMNQVRNQAMETVHSTILFA